jgi:hypothetical protein
MSRIQIVFFSLAGLFFAGVALGEDFWIKKEYPQWSDEEVRKMMTDSPWAKDVTVRAPASAVGGRGSRGAGASAGADVEANAAGGARGGRGRSGRGGGGGDSDAGGESEVFLTLKISWRSALPMKEAVLKSRGITLAEAQQALGLPEKEYVIVVSGLPMRLAAAVQNPSQLQRSMLKAGKKTIALAAADFQQRTQTVDMFLVFPRTEPLTVEDKEVEVVAQLGQLEARKKFNLKDMVYKGKLEL